MGNRDSSGLSYVNFETVQKMIPSSFHSTLKLTTTIIINTLPSELHAECVILGTASPNEEEDAINAILEKRANIHQIVLYGKNSCDVSVAKKIEQFRTMGIIGSSVRVLVYTGGLFEWLLLQEIYGEEQFPIQGTAKKPIDLLKYK